MTLICEKHKDEYESAEAFCEHSEEYCKFRESCIINFLAEERRREEKKKKDRKEGWSVKFR